MHVTRRFILAGGLSVAGVAAAGAAGYGLVEGGVLPGKYRLDEFLGACGSDPGLPDVTPGPVLTRTFLSRYRRRRVTVVTMLPPDPRPGLPVCLVLHGASSSALGSVQLGYPQFLAAAVRSGHMPPVALVAADGGPATWWHRRADGDDPAGMLMNEVLPQLSSRGFRTSKMAVTGWSMGGFGALLFAQHHGPGLITAVAAASPAIYPSYANAVAARAGSFDSPADFERNDVRDSAAVAVLRRMAVRIDCGSDDPFAPQVTRLRASLGNPPGTIDGGCHDQSYWRRHIPADLAFLGAHLQ